MLDLHRGKSRDLRSLEVAPNLWSGVGLVRGGAGTALVGSHEEVSERISEYADLGIDHFILSGYPHLEEAWQFAEGVVPTLARRGLIQLRLPERRLHGGSVRVVVVGRAISSRYVTLRVRN